VQPTTGYPGPWRSRWLTGGWARTIAIVGGFGIGAHIDWQILATIDCALQPSTDLHAGFRSLNFNYAGARAGFDVHLYGPIVSATFRF